ncbi:hypothetical protein RQP46_005529 [Phenoliferia psychrophenolica]
MEQPTCAFKNVVVIGLGLSGAGAANALAASLPPTHRVIAISATESAFYPISSLRGSVVDPWASKTTLPLDSFFPEGSRHVVLKGTQVVALALNSVVVDQAHPEYGFGTTIEFEYAVLATGSAYPGEIAAAHPTTKVTLVHSAKAFLEGGGFKPSLSESLRTQLLAMGVRLVFETRLDTGALRTGAIPLQTFDLPDGPLEADFLFIAYGNRPQSELVKLLDANVVNEAGRVRVKSSFQIDAEDSSMDHLFVIGDISDVDETKLWAHAQNHGAVVGANITQLIKSPTSTYLKSYTPGSKLIVISIGENLSHRPYTGSF